MEGQPLLGRRFRRSGASPAATLVAHVLADLGARVEPVAPTQPAEIVQGDGQSAAGGTVLSAYGLHGRFAVGPEHHSAVEAVGGALSAQYAFTPGPVYLVSPYSTVAQALLATAALLAGQLPNDRRPALPVSALQGLLAIQSGFYSFGEQPDLQRFDHSPRGQTPFYSTYRAADDWLFFGGSTTTFMIKVLQVVGLDDLLGDPRLHEGPRALRDRDLARELWERIGAAVLPQPRVHWLARCEAAKIPAGPVLSPAETLQHPHMRAAGLTLPDSPIDRLQHPVTVTRHTDGQARERYADAALPLAGLRVVELAGYIAGPYVGRLLTDLGAGVVKIEPPDGDPFRTTGYGFAAWNYGKRALALNLRQAADRDRLLRLVAEADVLVTNYRPDALARMGLGRDALFGVNPVLIHCTVSAFGESGPLAHLQGFDPVVQALAGIMKRQGGDDEPVKPQMAATDYLSGLLGTIGVLAALLDQQAHGGGYIVRTSLLAAALLLNFEAYEDLRAGRQPAIGGRDFKGPHALNSAHETRDGWLLTAAPAAAPDRYPAAFRYLAQGVRDDETAAAIARLAALSVPAVPCFVPADMPAEAHFRDNELWLTLDEHGLGPITRPAPVLASAMRPTPAPRLGEHNAVEDLWNGGSDGDR